MNLSIDLASAATTPDTAVLGAKTDEAVRLQPPAGDLDMDTLVRFRSLMAAEDQPVQIARMFYDRLYAYERIACAHASAHAPLRQLALTLFQTCHRNDNAQSLAKS